MASGSTARLNLPFPLGTDPTNIPADFGSGSGLAGVLDSLITAYESGTIGALPAPGVDGRIYHATDTSPPSYYFDNGSAWVHMGPGAISNGAITSSQPGDVSTAGTSNLWANADHRHGRTDGLLSVGVSANFPGAPTAIYNTSSTTSADIDPTNLKVSFTAPPSGRVLLTFTCVEAATDVNTYATYGWSVLSGPGSPTLHGFRGNLITAGFGLGFPLVGRNRITALNPGSNYVISVNWRQGVSSSGNQSILAGVGTGEAIITCEASP